MTKETRHKLVKGLVQFSKYTAVFLGGVATAALINEYGDAIETKELFKKKQEELRNKLTANDSGMVTDTGKPIILAHKQEYKPANVVEVEDGDYTRKVDLDTGFSVISSKKTASMN